MPLRDLEANLTHLGLAGNPVCQLETDEYFDFLVYHLRDLQVLDKSQITNQIRHSGHLICFPCLTKSCFPLHRPFVCININ